MGDRLVGGKTIRGLAGETGDQEAVLWVGPTGCETGGLGNCPANHLTPKLGTCIPTV